MLVSCPHCSRKNRLPAEKLTGEGNCGACKRKLFTGKPLRLDADTFASHANVDLPLVVDFWAPWCGPCRQFAPAFEAVAAAIEPRARFGKVNTEEEPAIAQRFAIRSIPTLMIFRNGREVARLSGALPGKQFESWVLQHL